MVFTATTKYALDVLKRSRGKLTKQQHRTIRGQIYAGYPEAALKGLAKLLSKKEL